MKLQLDFRASTGLNNESYTNVRMALQQLVAAGNEERVFGIENKEAHEYNSNEFIGRGLTQSCRLLRVGDTVNIKGIVFDSDLELEQLWSKIDELRFEIGEQRIVKIDKPILEIITTTEKIDTKWVFLIDFTPFLPSIPRVALAFHEVKLHLHLNDRTGIHNIDCITSNTYLDMNPRRELNQQRHDLPIQQLQGDTLDFDERRDVFIDIQFTNICKGYFICGDINNIQCITLKYNNQERYKYDRVMLRMVGKKISDTVLYIPYNPSKDWKDRSFNSYVDGCNHSRIDIVQMKVDFSTPQTNIGLYGLNLNILRVVAGMGGLSFHTDGHIVVRRNWRVDNVRTIPVPPTVIEWTTATKPVPVGKSFCPIAYNEIESGAEYCECSECHNCFSANELKTMFKTMEKKCPLCRKGWTNWVIYTNKEETGV